MRELRQTSSQPGPQTHDSATEGDDCWESRAVFARWRQATAERGERDPPSRLEETAPDPSAYRAALARFDEARTLLDAIGFTGQDAPVDVEVDLSRWPRLLLRSLEAEYDMELTRLQDAAAHGIELPAHDMPALESLLAEIRKKTGGAVRGQHVPLERQPESRRTRRSRGDG